MPEGFHGVGKYVPGHRLYEVFGNLWAVSFQPGPLSQVDAFVGHALGAKPVHTDAGFDVGESSSGRQVDEQHPALVIEAEPV